MDYPLESIKVYDSAFDNQPPSVLKAIRKAFVAPEQIVQISVMNTDMQCGPNDCGVYVSVMTTSIAYGEVPCYLSYNPKAIQCHLAQSFKMQEITPFQLSH